MSNRSDYTKPHIDLMEFLQGTTFDTDVNRSLVDNTFNRFLTKDETIESIGTIGQHNSALAASSQLKETTVHRQTYQLQPMVHHKVATVDHMMSFQDFLNTLERDGVIISRLDKWANLEQFNYMPPVDMDKLINYRDYYWYDENAQYTVPQYVTIKTDCASATARLSQRERDIAGMGNSIRVIRVDPATSAFVVTNDITSIVPPDTPFDITGNESIAGQYTVSSSEYVDGYTFIVPVEEIPSLDVFGGVITFDSQLALLNVAKNIGCGLSAGWDNGLWDDANPINSSEGITPLDVVTLTYIQQEHPDLYKAIANVNPSVFTSVSKDPLTGELTVGDPIDMSAKAMYEWMLSPQPEFVSSWDAEGTRTVANPWQIDNKWVHKLDLPPGTFSQAIRAEAPIIEYFSNLQMNAWVEIQHSWLYRENPITDEFAETSAIPTLEDITASDFKDKWVYSGVANARPAPPQPLNSSASVMSTGSTAVDKLSTYITLACDSVAPSGSNTTVNITTSQAPDELNSILVDTGADLRSRNVVSMAWVDSNVLQLTITGHVALSDRILIPNSELFNVVLFPNDPSFTEVALAGTNMARVYVNEIQQVGNYQEVTKLKTVNSTTQPLVVGIEFLEVLTQEQVVAVGIQPAAAADVGYGHIAVRTIEYLDDLVFSESGSPMTTVNLTRFFKQDQTKEAGEQKYPLFDLFLPTGEPAYAANSIFKHAIDPSSPVNKYTGLRLKTASNRTTYFFDQQLIDVDNGRMLCYIDNDSITEANPTGLQTIWRADPGFKYVPKIVDVNRRVNGEKYFDESGVEQTAVVDASNGDWEIIDPWMYNPSHLNYKEISTTQLIEHALSVLNSQPTEVGFNPSQYGFRLKDQLSMSVGGLIKEHNHSPDLLISAAFVGNYSPLDVINFAQQSYLSCLGFLEDYVTGNIYDYLIDKSPTTLTQLSKIIAESALTAYELNDNNNLIFGDTTAVYGEFGISNWPATLPILGLADPIQPLVVEDPSANGVVVKHHDGHYETYNILQNVITATAQRLLSTTYVAEDTSVRRYGWSSSVAADGGTVVGSYADISVERLAAGDVWVDGTTFKRLAVSTINALPPAYDPEVGDLWLRKSDGMIMSYDGADWYEFSSNIEDAWTDVNFNEIVADVILTAETKLYESARERGEQRKIDESVYVLDEADRALLTSLEMQQFNDFCASRSITAPFASVYVQSNPWSWNYGEIDANERANNLLVNIVQPFASNEDVQWAGSWRGIYKNIYGTPYPNQEPWVLQGYPSKPDWWDAEYADTTGNRRWTSNMWQMVLDNLIPQGVELPPSFEGTPVLTNASNGGTYWDLGRKFNYVPVAHTREIRNSNGEVIYGLDDLFPPYDSRLLTPTNADISTGNRNVSPVIVSQVVIANINTRASYQFGDMSPVEWEWRKSTTPLYGTLINAYKMQPFRVFAHLWGHETVNVGGLDVSMDTHTVYGHTNTIFHGDVIDGEVFQVNGLNQWYVNYNRNSGLDLKVSNFRELWTSWVTHLSYQFGCFINTRSFDVTSSSFDLMSQDYSLLTKKSNGFDMKQATGLMVSVAAPGAGTGRSGVKVPTGNGDDWVFNIASPSNRVQTIEIYNPKLFGFEVHDMDAGTFRLTTGSTLPWTTGDELTLSTTKYLPYPLDDSWTYYIYVVPNTNTFKLARKKADAIGGIGTVIRTHGTGEHFIGSVRSSFVADPTVVNKVWKHYESNTGSITTVSLPTRITGVQNVINLIDGYAARLRDLGVVANHNAKRTIDAATGRLVGWQTEIENLLNQIYSGAGAEMTVSASARYYGTSFKFYPAIDGVNTFRFTKPVETLVTGSEVYVYATGTPPGGLTLNTPYYIILSDDKLSFKFAATAENAYLDIPVITSDDGIGELSIGVYGDNTPVTRSSFIEVNPFRTDIWIETPVGILGNVLGDEDTDPGIFTEHGNPMTRGMLIVLRQDQLTRISVKPGLSEHLGAAVLSLDGFEHVVMFNDYTTDGYLMFDSYIGLDIGRLNVSFNRASQQNLRPSIGGYYVVDGEMRRNIEASVGDMRSFFDIHSGTNISEYADYSRALLGYENPVYLDQIKTNDKAKFLFWKGMIQQKGSKSTINAFINSKHFIDAKIDEFWAYRAGMFGDARPKIKPQMRVFDTDVYGSDLKYQFKQDAGDPRTPRFADQSTFTGDRWIDAEVITSHLGERMYIPATLITKTLPIQETNGTMFIELDTHLDLVEFQFEQGYGEIGPGEWAPNPQGWYDGIVKLNDSVYIIPESHPFGDGSVTIRGYRPATQIADPISLIDADAGVTVANTKFWDPANNAHNHVPLKDVTYMQAEDPAAYDGSNWVDTQIGATWVDTSSFGFVPYYDQAIYPDFTERLVRWGRMAAWSDVTTYEWVRSTVHPSEYVKLAAEQETDISIAPELRASGEPLQVFMSGGEIVDLSPIHEVIDPEFRLTQIKANSVYENMSLQVFVNGVPVSNQESVQDASLDDIQYTAGDVVSFRMIPYDSNLDYKFIEMEEADVNGVTYPVYYFWAANRKVAPKGKMSAAQISNSLAYPNAPYHIYSHPERTATGAVYTHVTIRGIEQSIANDRYLLEFTHDQTLRDDLSIGRTALDLKNVHAEWIMFREKQPYKISQFLWDKMSEALIGFQLNGFDEGERRPVPAISKALYDEQYNTTTRFGLEDGQAFADRTLGIQTIVDTIESADFDTAPIDKFVFMNSYTFDTPVNIRRAMQYIFSSFSDESVNRLFFEVMRDALTSKMDYKGLFMTSFISLHGIKILETPGSVIE